MPTTSTRRRRQRLSQPTADGTVAAIKEWQIQYKEALVDIDTLNIDQSYQRLEQPLATYIAEAFDPLAFGMITVAARKRGRKRTLYVVDGQQRMRGAQLAGYKQVHAKVFQSKGPRQEAALFKQINAFRKRVSRLEIFRAAVRSGSKSAKEILATVRASGFDINMSLTSQNRGVHWPYINAVSSVEKVYRDGEKEQLQRVLTLVKDIWPEQDACCYEQFIVGVHRFITNKGESLDEAKMKAKCSRKVAAKIIQAAEIAQAKVGVASGFKRWEAVEQVLNRLYNSRQQKAK